MSAAELQTLLPLILLGAGALAVMLIAAFYQGHRTANVVTLVMLAASFASLFLVTPRAVGALLTIDSLALFYLGLIVVVSLVVTVFSYGYLSRFHLKAEEFYMLLLLAALGAGVLAASRHFASFLLGLELLSVSLYVMIGYVFRRGTGMEAAVKYLILAAAASAFLLFGMALVYAELGSISFAALADGLREGAAAGNAATIAGIVLMLTGIGFKLAVVPFHLWTPDIYQGAPAPVGAFIATASKGAVVVVLLRFFGDFADFRQTRVFTVVAVVAVASMTLGNLLALRQGNLKRVLAYSSIAHLGYILVAFLAGGSLALEAATFYLAVYAVATLGAFGLISALATRDGEPEAVDDFRGLFWQRPWLGLALAAVLLSLIGLPPTGGFWGKLFIIRVGVESGLWVLVVLLALNSAVGLYYYLRILIAACGRSAGLSPLPAVGTIDRVMLGLVTLAVFALGAHPGPLLDLIRSLVMAGVP